MSTNIQDFLDQELILAVLVIILLLIICQDIYDIYISSFLVLYIYTYIHIYIYIKWVKPTNILL